jgi:ATP-binding cassette subfamily F protein 3
VSLLVASGLSLAHGRRVLLSGATFSVGPRDRIGLVGANGTGKSSLLRILAGELAPDAGRLAWRRGARAGHLPQDLASLPEGPLLEVVLASVPGRAEVEARLGACETALAAARETEEQLELSGALADLREELEHFEEHHGRRRAERILAGLGFGPGDLRRPAGELSGGWRMRAALAGLLLTDPDLLLLDEPTNHLDVPTLAWLDGFLRDSRRALVLVSHDREFLNRQVARILSLEPEGLRSWAGSYDDYRRQRAQEAERLEARAARVEARRAQLQAFVDRFGAKASKASQARSKEKMLGRLEEVAVREERARVRFRFAGAPRSGREVLRLERLDKAFGPRVVYRGLDAAVLRGERVGVIGANGAGKSTLLRLVAGELAPDAGRVVLGHLVSLAYYAQHHVEGGGAGGAIDPRLAPIDPRRTVLETLQEAFPERGEAELRAGAGAFLFSGDDVEKPVGVLSGGERARVALARVLLAPANLLLLDEPTNHLDIGSAEALIDALEGFPGTMLFVSHDRSFLNRLATRTWEVRGGGVADAPGNLDDWLYHQRALAASAGVAGEAPPDAGRTAPGGSPERQRRRAEAEARNARSRRERPLREEIARLEARIDELERARGEAEAALAEPGLYEDFARARPHVEARAAADAALPGLYQRWEAAQRELQEDSGD